MKSVIPATLPSLRQFTCTSFNLAAAVLLITEMLTIPATASDHGDMPTLGQLQRQDARITDLYSFCHDDHLVLAVCLNPAIPPTVKDYVFSSDITVRFHIDTKAEVDFEDREANRTMGGTLLEPGKVKDRISLQITFSANNEALMKASGLSTDVLRQTKFFAGLRDDPFIRGPRIGRNVAAIVVALPLKEVLHRQSQLLIWATTEIPELRGVIADHAGRALRSMFPENDAMNGMPPCDHHLKLGLIPDVIIFDTSRPAVYPNGRSLSDDVVDLVGDSRILANDDPFPDANDLPFLVEFPYLAPPHPAP